MVAVDKRQVKAVGLLQLARQGDPGLLGAVLHHPRDPRLLQALLAAPREPRRLVGVEGDVASRRRIGVPQQALAGVERGDAVAETDLDRPGRPPSLATRPRSASPSTALAATGKIS